MTDIFNEISEDLRRDRLKKVWSRYGIALLGLAVLIVAGVAGWRIYEHYQSEQAKASGDRYFAALQMSLAGDHTGAEAAFRKLQVDGPLGYAVLARLKVASEQAMAGDQAAALKTYDAVVSDRAVAPALVDAARMRGAYLALDLEDRAAVEARVAPLLLDTNPWRHSAREVMALAAIKAGDSAGAAKSIETLLADAALPREIAARADVLQSVIRGSASADSSTIPKVTQ